MSVFNSNYFDAFVYNGADTTSPLAFNRFLAADVSGDTIISSTLRTVATLNSDLTGNSTLIPTMTADIVFSSIIDSTSNVISSLFEYDSLYLEIDSSSSVDGALRLISTLNADITGDTSTSATMTEYEFLSSIIDASTSVSAYALTKNNEVLLKTDITGKSIISSALNPDYRIELTVDITGTTNLDSSILSKFSIVPLNVIIDGTSNFIINEISPEVRLESVVDASTSVTANIRYDIVTLSADITGKTTVSDKINRNVRLTLKKESKIIENKLVWYYVNEPLNITGSTTIVKSNLIISNMLRLGRARRLPFISPSIETIDNDNLDTFFKIMKLYQSLSNSKVILESVRRQAQEELDAYLKGNNSNIQWTQDLGTLDGFTSGWLDNSGNPTIPVNTKAYIGSNASGVFRGKDGWFAVYIGKEKR